ncbi:FTR1 family protein [Streptomyces sp. NPDC047315]|uniref:FTR1 family protein n=1 Tax=Streptomyces sp. NPDC047315 TaxID=3155142 RepID=UPI0033D1095A
MDGTCLYGLRLGLAVGAGIALQLALVARTKHTRPVWTTTATTTALFLGLGGLLEFGSRQPTPETRSLVTGTLALAAVAAVTWFVVRLRTGRPAPATLLIAVTALLIGREGLEGALYFWSAARAATGVSASAQPLLGLALGLAIALLAVWGLYAGVRRAGPERTARWTAAALGVIAAGMLVQGVSALQDAGAPGATGSAAQPAYDLTATVPPDSWYGTALNGLVHFLPDPTVLQVTVWFLYAVPALLFALAPIGFGRSVGGAGAKEKTTDG